jgi:hypothetical protein
MIVDLVVAVHVFVWLMWLVRFNQIHETSQSNYPTFWRGHEPPARLSA